MSFRRAKEFLDSSAFTGSEDKNKKTRELTMWRHKCSIEITQQPYAGDINQAAFMAGDKP